jgi:hypothetical protein
MITTVLAQLKTSTRVAAYVLVAILVVSFWQDPSGSAETVGDFVGGVGSFCAKVVDKLAEFVRALDD